MLKCNFCPLEIQDIEQTDIDQGWGRIAILYQYHDARPDKTDTIIHCPDHREEAFNLIISLVTRSRAANVGIRLKESILRTDTQDANVGITILEDSHLFGRVARHLIDNCERPEKPAKK